MHKGRVGVLLAMALALALACRLVLVLVLVLGSLCLGTDARMRNNYDYSASTTWRAFTSVVSLFLVTHLLVRLETEKWSYLFCLYYASEDPSKADRIRARDSCHPKHDTL